MLAYQPIMLFIMLAYLMQAYPFAIEFVTLAIEFVILAIELDLRIIVALQEIKLQLISEHLNN